MLCSCADFGVDHLVWVAGETNFPWLLSNVRERETGRLLANGEESLVIPWCGKKVSGYTQPLANRVHCTTTLLRLAWWDWWSGSG